MSEQTTKDKILGAARKLFAESGFSGTSIGKIAKLAGVNHSLIFHHFENKENLWREVKLCMVKDSNQSSKMLPTTDQPFADFIQQLIINSMQFYRQHPDIIRMINWQRLEYDSEHRLGITQSREMQAWMDAFKHYQTQGDVNQRFQPEFIVTFVLSIISSAALDKNEFLNETKAMNEYIIFCRDRIVAALH